MQYSYHRCSYSTAGELEESPWQTSTDPAVFSKCSLTTSFSFCSPFYPSLTNTTKTARERERDSHTPALPHSKTLRMSKHALFLTHTLELWMLHTQVERCRAELILKGTLLTAHSFIHNHSLPCNEPSINISDYINTDSGFHILYGSLRHVTHT